MEWANRPHGAGVPKGFIWLVFQYSSKTRRSPCFLIGQMSDAFFMRSTSLYRRAVFVANVAYMGEERCTGPMGRIERTCTIGTLIGYRSLGWNSGWLWLAVALLLHHVGHTNDCYRSYIPIADPSRRDTYRSKNDKCALNASRYSSRGRAKEGKGP